tara:strand:- start:1208 stop:1774 length:567 start_codon:yes stop_codon:yes gene_type:complete
MDKDQEFLKAYWNEYKKLILQGRDDSKIISFRDCIKDTIKSNGKLYFVGNGASASLCSHAATDFTKQAKIEAHAFNDHNLITALSNDYGYENWVSKAIEYYVKPCDRIIFISVSGNSPNLVNGLKYAKKENISTASLTGSNPNNFLNINSDCFIWVDSKSYNIVESIHTIYITLIIDLFIGKTIYSVN